jgi:nitrate reductase NapE component
MIRPTKKQALLTFIVLLPLLLWSSAVIALAGGVGGVVWGPRTALAFAAFVASS